MMKPTFFYPDTEPLPLPAGHRFPAGKYLALRSKLIADAIVGEENLVPAPLASRDDLVRAHDASYVDAVADGTLDRSIQRRIGLPWSPVLARRSRATVGGTLAAARVALEIGLSGQLAGGTHHAHHAFGSGYCTFNDFAVAALVMLGEKQVARIGVLDLDVHQGDGNAALLASRPDVYVVSVHGAKNFPFRKIASDLDIALPDGTEDRAYLHAVVDALDALAAFRPELVLYNSGVDALKEDKLGRLNVSVEGLHERDLMVFRWAERRAIPMAFAIGGGYADPITASVACYAQTFAAAREVFRC